MRAAKLVHELLPERGAALFEHLGANAQRAARGPVAKSPAAELREHGYELNRGFGQAVARPLAGSRVLTGEQSQLDESLESVGVKGHVGVGVPSGGGRKSPPVVMGWCHLLVMVGLMGVCGGVFSVGQSLSEPVVLVAGQGGRVATERSDLAPCAGARFMGMPSWWPTEKALGVFEGGLGSGAKPCFGGVRGGGHTPCGSSPSRV